jgi:cell cycle checkpoint control protein RAD9A
MVVLNFTLTPEAAAKVHDILVCLGKFSDTVAIEAKRQRVRLSHLILNSRPYPFSSSHLSLSTLQNQPMQP